MSSELFKKEILPLRHQLFRVSLKMLDDSEDAEDAVQEVLLKLWSKRDALVTYHNPTAFAKKKKKNHCLDKLKLKKETETIDNH